MALQFDYRDNEGNTTAGKWGDFNFQMRESGILPGVWFTDSFMLPFAPPAADFVVAEIEGAHDYEGLVDSLGKLNDDQQHAVITTFDGLRVLLPDGSVDVEASKKRCKPLVDAGFYCQYEAYFYDQPDNTDAEHCGWAPEMVAPVLGVGFNGRTLEEQKALQVHGYGLYLAEYLP